jgi:chromosomal replication initiation ATPase DnaA
MTKNTKFNEIKLAMRAGHYEYLSTKEKNIYKNAFKNGYRLSQSHIKKQNKIYIPKKIVGVSFAKPSGRIVESIINKVCIKYEVHKKTLMSKARTQDIVRARNIIHNLLHEKYKLSLTEIGRYFGQDHTTVLHSIEMKRFGKRFWHSNQSLWQEYKDLKETIS